MKIKSPQEIAVLREGGKRLAAVVQIVADAVRPGVTALELDTIAAREIKRYDATPAFLGYNGYPNVACISVNEQVVHGIPRQQTVIQPGDIVSVDLGLVYQKLFTDMAVTVGAGTLDPEVAKLLEVTRASLYEGIRAARAGSTTGDIGYAVQQYAEGFGFSVVRQLVGHGVGYQVHEPPQVPNFGKAGTGVQLIPGLVIAIEPMLNLGSAAVETMPDGWTIVTHDGAWSAHFEHTVAITDGDPEILTRA
ncbi:MAG: type I methionyl aminopeptidase [Candidatus Kerfeldbacteria bacterium]|nr:type I methionyl aminopeptidase [Candidatus Kerfeldbacteria bacterium]